MSTCAACGTEAGAVNAYGEIVAFTAGVFDGYLCRGCVSRAQARRGLQIAAALADRPVEHDPHAAERFMAAQARARELRQAAQRVIDAERKLTVAEWQLAQAFGGELSSVFARLVGVARVELHDAQLALEALR